MSGTCSMIEYEPESWKEMNEDLEAIQEDINRLNKGFYPNDWNIRHYLNVQFMDDLLNCPFCFVERKGEIVIIKSTKDEEIKELLRQLLEHKKWKEARRARHLEITKHDPSFRPVPPEKFVLKLKAKKKYYQLIASYSLIKHCLSDSMYDVLRDHQESMEEYRYEFEDSPRMFDDAMPNLRMELEDVFYKIENGDDCDKLIRCLNKVIERTKNKRDSQFTKKIDSL